MKTDSVKGRKTKVWSLEREQRKRERQRQMREERDGEDGKKAGRAKDGGGEGMEQRETGEQRNRGDLRGDFFKTAPVRSSVYLRSSRAWFQVI